MSTVSVTTRKMQSVHYTVVLLCYAVFGIIVLSTLLLLEKWAKHEPLRLLQYSREQVASMAVTSVFNAVGLTCQTIAMQNERAGFVTLIGYVGLVYAFLGDVLIFG